MAVISIALTLYNLASRPLRCHHEKGVGENCAILALVEPMSFQSFAMQCRWYLRALDRSPLIRTSDRLEALSILALFVMTIVAIPVATQFGHHTYDATIRTVEQEAHSRHPVQAQVVQGSTGLPTDFDTPLYIVAKWRDGTQQRTEQIISPGTVQTGAELTIWLDPTGKVVNAPLTPGDAGVNALSVAWTIWLLAVVISGLGALGIRKWLDRSRAQAWERALQLLAHNDDGWANRRM
ncbi:MAG: hypothetical protein JWR13_2199 [Mycobacterium sp.]|jgi:hypothetical protein|nr:hypothetical protein [Mycobacterium sp.]MDT5311131.1 hypothetical protein [Mycobacterium sp.]